MNGASSGLRLSLYRHAAVCFVLVYSAFLAAWSRTGFPDAMHGVPTSLNSLPAMPYLADKPVGEDAYYMLTVAWNLGLGRGLVANEGQSVTGIQPLVTILYAGVGRLIQAAGGTRWTFVRSVILINSILFVLFAYQLRYLSRRITSEASSAPELAFALTILNFSLYRIFTYGLETGAYLCAFALVLSLSLSITRQSSTVQLATFGMTMGLCGLVRIDFAVMVGSYLSLCAATRFLAFRQVLLVGSLAFLVVSPWLIWVHEVSESWLPSSGSAQAALLTLGDLPKRVEALLVALLDHVTPWTRNVTPDHPILITGEVACSVVMIVVVIMRRRAIISVFHRFRAICFWSVSGISLVFVYFTCFWATHFYHRYTAFLNAFVIPLFAVALAGWIAQRLRRPSAFSCLFLSMFVGFATFAVLTLHIGKIDNSHVITTGFSERCIPASVRVGAFQSGVIGYFLPNTYNLDGKLNREILPYLDNGDVMAYLDTSGINVLVDWPAMLHTYLPGIGIHGPWITCREQPGNGLSECYMRRDSGVEIDCDAGSSSSLGRAQVGDRFQ